MKLKMLALTALISVGTMVAMQTARAEECVSHGKVVTEMISENGGVRIHAYTTGFCNPWEAIGYGLSAAVVEARRVHDTQAPVAIVGTIKK